MQHEWFDIPEDMAIPEARRKANFANASWLLRNASVHNLGHPALRNVQEQARNYIRNWSTPQ